ncbi:hypothetical protein GOODEAATRI_013714 [Goodea atripinnis]|uniref:Uncharacterized protein n=1 Tax=Goodea atripinnis TaxID=208336 RepID=A0ABV0NAI9_9TELE
MFWFEKTPRSASQQGNGKSKLINRVCNLLTKTSNIREENEYLTKQVRKMTMRSEDTKALVEDYKYLKRQIEADRKLNQELKQQVHDLKLKLEAQKVLEEKYETKQKELQNLVQSNNALHNEVVTLNLKLNDPLVLQENYRRATDKTETMMQQNSCLVKQVKRVQQKLSQQNKPESLHTKKTAFQKLVDQVWKYKKHHKAEKYGTEI